MRRVSRLTVAMHEAGHAVVLLANPPTPVIAGMSVFDPDGGILGHVDTIARWRPGFMDRQDVCGETLAHWRTLARQDILFFLAGPIAELRWTRHSRGHIWCGAQVMAERCLGQPAPTFGTDLENVRRRLLWSDPDRAREVFVKLWLEAEEQVARQFRAIEWLGRTLCERGHLDGEEIKYFWSAWTALKSGGTSRPARDCHAGDPRRAWRR